MPDLVELKIKFSAHEVDVEATSAFIDDNGVLIIRCYDKDLQTDFYLFYSVY